MPSCAPLPHRETPPLTYLKLHYNGESMLNLTRCQRKLAKVRGRDSAGKLQLRAPGTQTSVGKTRGVRDGRYNYAVSAKGSLYINIFRWHVTHANILSGRPVRSAGTLQVHQGRIVQIDNDSGHYRPTTQQFTATVAALASRGWLDPACHVWLPHDGAQRLTVAQLPQMPAAAATWTPQAHEQPQRRSATWRLAAYVSQKLTCYDAYPYIVARQAMTSAACLPSPSDSPVAT